MLMRCWSAVTWRCGVARTAIEIGACCASQLAFTAAKFFPQLNLGGSPFGREKDTVASSAEGAAAATAATAATAFATSLASEASSERDLRNEAASDSPCTDSGFEVPRVSSN